MVKIKPLTPSMTVEVQPTYKVEQTIINQGYTPTNEELTIDRSASSFFYKDNNAWILQQFGDRLTFSVVYAEKMLYSTTDKISSDFVLTFKPSADVIFIGGFAAFSIRTNLPTIKWPEVEHSINCQDDAFSYLDNVRELPDDYFGDKGTINNDGYSGNWNHCYSLRHIPTSYFAAMQRGRNGTNRYAQWMGTFAASYWLDELVGVPVDYTNNYTSNKFNFSGGLSHLKDYIFATDNGQPYTAKWKNQTMRLNAKVGYWDASLPLYFYNSGITADKEVSDATTYSALKNDPDWFTLDKSYSRYNHDSALRTIENLPDCSAYVASGGTNTLIFEAEAGANTDGGACGALTAEEIAIASAKGWTISFT